jgi:ParB family chromosome partitioning protein
MPETRPFHTITLGERHRRDLGDLTALVQSIKEVGLLHPVVITSQGQLIAGARRVGACRSLGWPTVPDR